MSVTTTLKQELIAGFTASVQEAAGYPGVELDDLTTYERDELIEGYSHMRARQAIDCEQLRQQPDIFPVDHEDEGSLDDASAADLMAADDLKLFIKAEKDAARAEAEAARLIARMDRFMDTARVINRMALDNKEGEK